MMQTVKPGDRVYVAGPMTNIAQFNFPRFDEVVDDLEVRGYDVVPPADLYDPKVRKQALASPDGSLGSVSACSWGDALAADVKMLADDGIDGVVLIEDWENSRGARLESFVAKLCGLAVVEYRLTDPMLPVIPLNLGLVFAGVASIGID